jgi:hypothetical protein
MHSSHTDRQDTRVAGFLCFVGLAFLLGACSREPRASEYVARVDGSTLTRDDLAAAIDTAAGSMRQYVNDWIVAELLYQEATRRGFLDSETLRRQFEQTKKRLAIAALLDKELYGGADSLAITDAAVKSYFDSSGSMFTLRQDIIRASYALFSERDAANQFRSLLLRGHSWPEIVGTLENDTLLAHHLQQLVTGQYYTASTLYPQELWKLAHSLRPGEVSFVLKAPSGFYVIQLVGMKLQGETPDLDYVRDEVRNRILMEARRTRYEKLIADLRARHAVDIRLSETPSPSSDVGSH